MEISSNKRQVDRSAVCRQKCLSHAGQRGPIVASDKIERNQPNTMLGRLWSYRAVFFDRHRVVVLVFLHPPDQDGGQGRVEFWQEQGADAGQGPQQNDLQGRGRRRGSHRGGFRTGGVFEGPEEIPAARRAHSQGRADGRARPARAKRCWPRPSPARRTRRFSASAARISWKCSSASAPAACATCSSRRATTRRA